MSDQTLDPNTDVWTKEKCLEVVGKCATKEEVEEKFPEAASTIKDNKWFYMYGEKHIGTNMGGDIQEIVSDTALPPPPQPKEIKSPLAMAAKNLKEEPITTRPEPPKPTRKAKTYKLKKYAPLSFTLNVGRNMNLRIFDQQTQSERAIRHCPNSRTIFVDQQNPDVAVVEPIVFIKGFFYADERMGYTQDFLDTHPKNGQVFEEMDPEMDARGMVDLEDIIIDIKNAIRDRMKEEGGIEEVRAIVSVLNADVVGAAKMTPSEIRFAAYQCVNSNPRRFLNDKDQITIFDDPTIKRTAIAQHAFVSGAIHVSPNGRQVLWGDTRKPICEVPVGLNYLKVFSDFLSSDEGFHIAQELTKR